MLLITACVFPEVKFIALHNINARIRLNKADSKNPIRSNWRDDETRSNISKRKKAAKKKI